MIDKIFSFYERNVKYVIFAVPIVLFVVMAYLYVKAS
jgi:hypothetical protein